MKVFAVGLVAAVHLSSPAFATDHHIRIDGTVYSPANLTVEVGDTIAFVNEGDAPHTATAIARGFDTALARGGAFDTETIQPGETVEITIRRSGRIAFASQYQPAMRGEIVAD